MSLTYDVDMLQITQKLLQKVVPLYAYICWLSNRNGLISLLQCRTPEKDNSGKDVSLGLADDVSEEDVSSSIGCVDVDIRSQHNAGICERHLKYCNGRDQCHICGQLR